VTTIRLGYDYDDTSAPRPHEDCDTTPTVIRLQYESTTALGLSYDYGKTVDTVVLKLQNVGGGARIVTAAARQRRLGGAWRRTPGPSTGQKHRHADGQVCDGR